MGGWSRRMNRIIDMKDTLYVCSRMIVPLFASFVGLTHLYVRARLSHCHGGGCVNSKEYPCEFFDQRTKHC